MVLLVNQQIKGADVVDFLDYMVKIEGCQPERIQVDNGSEFV